MDEGRSHGEAAINIGFLRCDPAKIIEPRQADMIDDKIKLGEIRRRIVDIGDIEGVAVERQDGRAFMDVNVFDAKPLGMLEIALGPGVGELPALRIVTHCPGFRHSERVPRDLWVLCCAAATDTRPSSRIAFTSLEGRAFSDLMIRGTVILRIVKASACLSALVPLCNGCDKSVQSETVHPTVTSEPSLGAAVDHVYTYATIASGSPSPTFALAQAPAGMTSCSQLAGQDYEMWRSDVGTEDWIEFYLDLPVAARPGTEVDYKSLNDRLAGHVIERQARVPLPPFAAENLFVPLGVESTTWVPGILWRTRWSPEA